MTTGEKRTLAIDLGETCGVAAGSASYVVSGSLNLIGPRGTFRAEKLLSRLNEIQAALGVERIVYKAPRIARTSGRRSLQRDLLSVLTTWAKANGVACAPCGEGAAKKAFSGRGNASAQQMMDEARRRSFRPGSVAEATAIALFHCALIGGERSRSIGETG